MSKESMNQHTEQDEQVVDPSQATEEVVTEANPNESSDEQATELNETTEETMTKENEEETKSEADLAAEKIAALEDQVLRLSAEMANIQKRQARERQDLAKFRSQSLAQELLPALDNLERALLLKSTTEEAKNIQSGVTMVKESILAAFKHEGIEVIDPLNELFDPSFHQAVQVVPVEEGETPDTVAQVLQKGYMLKERVLRPAMVLVRQ
ncbi:nucleotide exchange factor GrpE [Atopobacter phocae]|uniref:nucleotide exchange factor GrpE n=1 Tax=Atopobacter phocae TaxID=136492 RepID=UPI0004B1FA4D|nr:nucleotide exchange factor GrpE [Atopobacter phocae]